MSALLTQFEKIPRRLTLSVFWGGLLMAAGIAVVLGGPVYRDLRHQAELKALRTLDDKVKRLDIFFQDSLRAATEYRYIENSFKLDAELGQWWGMPGEPLEPATVPDIARVDLSRVKGMVRYSGQRQISGNPFGVTDTPLLPPGSQPVLHNVYNVSGARSVSILFPVSKGPDGHDGVDMVFCDASELTPMLAGTDFPGGEGHLSLMDTSGGAIRFLTPPAPVTDDAEAAENLLRKAARAARGASGDPWSFVDLGGRRLAVTQAPLSTSDWAVLLTVPLTDMYRGTRLKLVGMGGIAVVLALFLSTFSLAFSRPFSAFLKRMDHLLSRERSKRCRDARFLQEARWRLTTQNMSRELMGSLAMPLADNSAETPDGRAALAAFARIYGAEHACLWHRQPVVMALSTLDPPMAEQTYIAKALEDFLDDEMTIVIADTTAARLPASLGQVADQCQWRSLAAAAIGPSRQRAWGVAVASKKAGTFTTPDIAEWLVLIGTLLVCRKDFITREDHDE
ncbi:MAG: hypothetical protein RRC34_15235 [Lentisphaeria bacterium]|nr:hypothetical protein [Lentisphaeria bacterium]